MVIKKMASPYIPVEAFVYDRLIAPATNIISSERVKLFADMVGRNARFLDVGCGGGHFALSLKKLRPDLAITGIDISPQQVARAKTRSAEAGCAVEFLEGSVIDLPLESDSFDIVSSNFSIKHWPDPIGGLKECIRVLKPGGKLFIFELDKNCSTAEATPFVANWKIPFFMKPLARRLFLRFVSGRSISVEDATTIMGKLHVKNSRVERIPDRLGWFMQAEKPK